MKNMILILLVLLLPFAIADPVPDLSVSLLDYTPDPVQPGQAIDLSLEIANSGDPSSEAWVEIVEDYPFTVLPGGDSERAKSLKVVSGTQKLQFRILVDKEAQDGLTPLRVRYGLSRATSAYEEMEFSIQIETFGARLGVDKVEQIPSRLIPGQQGKLKLTLTNYDDQPLENVDVLLDFTGTHDINTNMDNSIAVQAMINARLEDVNRRIAAGLSPLKGATPMGVQPDGTLPETSFKAIAPVGIGTLMRIGTLDPGASTTITFDVQAIPDVTPGIYAIPLFVNYNDEDNNPFHTKTEIPFVIDMGHDALVQLKSSSLRSTDFAGEVTVLVANRGQGELRYASIELGEGDFTLITAPSEVYLGSLAPGETAEATFMILPETEDLEIPVTLSFRDSFNNMNEVKNTLELEIINKNYYRDMPYEMMLPWIILGLVVLALTAYFLSRLKK
ncbi:hypothetical protein GOV11_01070 [Candidatus Woesearchaeota archaeon]|nr:hypothetical protein [Candidatus Woesearchaeota archaeon]